MNEVSKIRDKVLTYLQGTIIDVGCSDCKIIPEAIGVDGRRMPGVDVVTNDVTNLSSIIGKEIADCLFSSHLLEHLKDDTATLMNWREVLKTSGYLILYLPDGRYYKNKENPEHMRDYNYEDFMFYFNQVFCGKGKDFTGKNFDQLFHVIESGLHTGDDLYSFWVVAQKIS